MNFLKKATVIQKPEKSDLTKTILEIFNNNSQNPNKSKMLFDILQNTLLFTHFNESFSQIFPHIKFFLAICDNLKFDEFDSKKDIFAEHENPKDLLIFIIEGKVEICEFTSKKQRINDLNILQNNTISENMNTISRGHKSPIGNRVTEQKIDKGHLFAFHDFALLNKRLFEQVEKHITRTRRYENRLHQISEKIKNDFNIKKNNLNSVFDKPIKSLTFKSKLQWGTPNNKIPLNEHNPCKYITIKQKRAQSIMVPKTKKDISKASLDQTKRSPSNSLLEKKYLSSIAVLSDGDLLGRFFTNESLFNNALALTENGTIILSIKKTQVFKILLILNSEVLLSAKPIILNTFTFDFKFIFLRELDYFLASIEVCSSEIRP